MTDAAPFALHVPTPLDPSEYLDITAPPTGPESDQMKEIVASKSLKLMFYSWDQVQAALKAGASSVEEAKRGLEPAFVHFDVSYGWPQMVLYGPDGYMRGEVEFVIRECPRAQVWNSSSELEVADMVMNFLPLPRV